MIRRRLPGSHSRRPGDHLRPLALVDEPQRVGERDRLVAHNRLGNLHLDHRGFVTPRRCCGRSSPESTTAMLSPPVVEICHPRQREQAFVRGGTPAGGVGGMVGEDRVSGSRITNGVGVGTVGSGVGSGGGGTGKAQLSKSPPWWPSPACVRACRGTAGRALASSRPRRPSCCRLAPRRSPQPSSTTRRRTPSSMWSLFTYSAFQIFSVCTGHVRLRRERPARVGRGGRREPSRAGCASGTRRACPPGRPPRARQSQRTAHPFFRHSGSILSENVTTRPPVEQGEGKRPVVSPS